MIKIFLNLTMILSYKIKKKTKIERKGHAVLFLVCIFFPK